MRLPNPHDFDSDEDYYDAREAYQAYLGGKSHPAQPLLVRQKLARRDPDSNYFDYD